MKWYEGKDTLQFTGYRWISHRAFTTTPELNVILFVWPYLLLIWNIGARNCNVANMMYDHISWENDSMVVVLPVTKSTQGGDNMFSKHLYANPGEPFMCPILAVAFHLVCTTYRSDPDRNSLFTGEKKEQRFSTWFLKLLSDATADETIKHLGNNCIILMYI